ncbi:MAG: DUF4338 domain-containing protein [Acidobacteria bacterium]|nr:DUF4338 domain-containing protein [Acidobacteriota bacterium]
MKNHECRQLLERLHQQGWLSLPPVRRLGPCGPRVAQPSRPDDTPPIQGSARDFEPIELIPVQAGSADSARWREWIAAYHYLGYRVPVGANLRYLVRSPRGDLACLQWSSPAWEDGRPRTPGSARTPSSGKRNLQYIVNHSRFLILPWVRVAGLAGKILAHGARQLPENRKRLYGYRPLLLETTVDAQRFAGTCYRAANWIPLGQTQGRGRMDRHHQVCLPARSPNLRRRLTAQETVNEYFCS